MSNASAVLASLGLFAAASAQDPVKFTVPGVTAPASPPAAPAQPPAAAPAKAPAAPAAPAKPAGKFTETQILEAYGWYMGAQMGLHEAEFTKVEVEAMARGMVGIVSGAQPPFDPKEIGPEVQAFMARKSQILSAKQQEFMGKLRTQNLADGQAFFTKLKENKAVVELPSGLRYEILKPATGAVAKPGQLVTIQYTGSMVNGQVFDSSTQRGQPLELPLVAATQASPNGIIPGLFEGLQKIGLGGKARLYIPPSLAYGDEGNQGIPPGATLIFEIEVVGVKDAPK